MSKENVSGICDNGSDPDGDPDGETRSRNVDEDEGTTEKMELA
jgi:hypothetical protein